MPPESKATGNILVNTQTGDEKYFSQEGLKSAIQSGMWRGREGDAMHVIDSSGKARTLNAADAGLLFREGGGPESEEHLRHREKEAFLEAKYGDSPFRAAFESVAKGATFGLSDPLMVAFGASKEGIRERNERTSRWITGIGEAAGIIAPALLTGGGSLVARGGAAATTMARHQVPLAAAKYSRAAQPSMAAKIAGMTPAGAMQNLSMRGARAVVPQAVREGTATGLAGVLGRASGWATQGVIDGVAYGAGTGFSTEILSDDPFTGEAMWDNMKAGALYGGVFGGGLSVLGDTGKFFKNHVAGKSAARKAVGDESAVINNKERWIQEETAKAATRKEVSSARKAERGAVSDQAKLDDEIARNAQKTEKEILALEKEIDVLVIKHEAATATAAMDLKRGHVRVAKAEEALDRAKLQAQKTGRKADTATAKAEMTAAKENQATLQKAADDAETKALADLKQTQKRMEELLTTPSTEGVTKFTERMSILYRSAIDHRGRGWALVRKEFNENWASTPGLSVTSKALDDALARFEDGFVAWDGRAAGYTREQFGVTRVSEGARQNLRVLNVDADQLSRMARKDGKTFATNLRAIEDLEAAIMAHRSELQKAIDGANAMRTVDQRTLVKMDMPADINKLLGQQFSPAEYMAGVRNAIRLTDSQTLLEKVGTAEVLGDVSGDPIDGIGERLESVDPTGGALSTGVGALLWFHGIKGSKKTAGKMVREIAEHSKNEPLKIAGEAVSSAKATLTEQEKRAAVGVLEEQVEAARMAGQSQGRREQELLDVMEEVRGLEALERTAPSGQTAVNLESARTRLGVAKKNRDAVASNADEIAAAQANVEEMRAATTLAEAKLIAQRADQKFSVSRGAKKRGGRVWRAVEAGVSQGTYTQFGTRTFGKNWKGAVAGSVMAGTARDVLGSLRGRGGGGGVGGMVGTAVVRTQEKIVSGVGGFLNLATVPLKVPHASISPVVLLNEMNFGYQEFEGKKRADEE